MRERRPNKLSARAVREIRAARLKGAPTDELAERFNVSAVTIWKHTRDLPRAPRGGRKIDPKRVAMLRSLGLTIREVAAHIGCHETSISPVLSKARKRKRLAHSPDPASRQASALKSVSPSLADLSSSQTAGASRPGIFGER